MKTETEQKTRQTIIYLITIIIIMRGDNFVAHLDGLGGTAVCHGTPVAHHCFKESDAINKVGRCLSYCMQKVFCQEHSIYVVLLDPDKPFETTGGSLQWKQGVG
jgi:hypothetical protein